MTPNEPSAEAQKALESIHAILSSFGINTNDISSHEDAAFMRLIDEAFATLRASESKSRRSLLHCESECAAFQQQQIDLLRERDTLRRERDDALALLGAGGDK